MTDKEREEFKAMTGWDTPAEWYAYDKGYEDCQELMLKFIAKWTGKTNSGLGQALHNKFTELKTKENEG